MKPYITLLCYTFIFCFIGCVEKQPYVETISPEERFEHQSEKLIHDMTSFLKYQFCKSHKAIVFPVSSCQSTATSLDHYFVRQIKKDVIHTSFNMRINDYHDLCSDRPPLNNPEICVYKLYINRETHLKKASVYVALQQGKHLISPKIAEMTLDYHQDSIAQKFDAEPFPGNWFPIGHSENPFSNLERLAYEMWYRIKSQYQKTGIQIRDEKKPNYSGNLENAQVHQNEIVLSLYAEGENGIPQKNIDIIEQAIKTVIIKSGLFRCSVNQEDLKKALKHISYCQKHGSGALKIYDVSRLKNVSFVPATVYFNIDIIQFNNNYKVTTNAWWLIAPKKAQDLDDILTNEGGTYIAVLTDFAYICQKALQ